MRLCDGLSELEGELHSGRNETATDFVQIRIFGAIVHDGDSLLDFCVLELRCQADVDSRSCAGAILIAHIGSGMHATQV